MMSVFLLEKKTTHVFYCFYQKHNSHGLINFPESIERSKNIFIQSFVKIFDPKYEDSSS